MENDNNNNSKKSFLDKEESELYARIRDDKAMKTLTEMLFSSQIFKHWWNEYISRKDFDAIKAMRRFIIKNTIWCCEQQNVNSFTYLLDSTFVKMEQRSNYQERNLLVKYAILKCMIATKILLCFKSSFKQISKS